MKTSDKLIHFCGMRALLAAIALASCVTVHFAYGQSGNNCSYQSCVSWTVWDPSFETASPCTGATYIDVINLTQCSNPCLAQVTASILIDGYCVADALFPKTDCNLADWPDPIPIYAYDSSCDAVDGDQPSCPCEIVDLGVQAEDTVVECTVENCP